ncbi:MAG: hypothetical protein U0232_06575 [Thermomicrobiales bacterium]
MTRRDPPSRIGWFARSAPPAPGAAPSGRPLRRQSGQRRHAAPLPASRPRWRTALPEPRTDPEALRLRAAALRERNRLLDSLNAATTAIDDALATLRSLGFG